ncbi:MAG: tetratricopeptide repeat protein, partial [Acidobacteria bacterium]|nr:tetratricopeptide repeat protein [Acidobacteriota bacterium]
MSFYALGTILWALGAGLWGSACAGGRSSSIPPSVPNEPLAKLAQANEYLTKGQCDRAVSLYREVIPRIESQQGLAPYQVAELYYYLGTAYLCHKDIEGAIAQFQRALALEPLYHPARNALAIAYMEKNLLDDAER